MWARTAIAAITSGPAFVTHSKSGASYDVAQRRADYAAVRAALGDEIEVPVIDGSRAKVKIPAGTQTGDQFRLRGKGFSVLRSAARGDMFIQVAVETPQNLSARQRELLEAFEAEAQSGGKGSPDHEGFFAKVAAFFEGGRS